MSILVGNPEDRFSRVRAHLVCHSKIFEFKRIHEPLHEKTNNLGFRPGLTQTDLYSHRRKLEA